LGENGVKVVGQGLTARAPDHTRFVIGIALVENLF